jgi:hypothetical protein
MIQLKGPPRPKEPLGIRFLDWFGNNIHVVLGAPILVIILVLFAYALERCF